MNKINAIETKAFGCWFRSRLEARWAVFFEALDVQWQYEPEGFELPSGRYLPDFLLQNVKCRLADVGDCGGGGVVRDQVWFEVKSSSNVGKASYRLYEQLQNATSLPLVIANGIPQIWSKSSPNDVYNEVINVHRLDTAGDMNYAFCICKFCGTVGIEYGGMIDRLCHTRKYGERTCGHDHPRLLHAYEMARSARFESWS